MVKHYILRNLISIRKHDIWNMCTHLQDPFIHLSVLELPAVFRTE